jgi:hypothetical protein
VPPIILSPVKRDSYRQFKGSLLIVVTNGVETLHVNLDELTVLHGHHRQYKPVSERPRRGFIGLQGDRGEQVEFRNIRVKEL